MMHGICYFRIIFRSTVALLVATTHTTTQLAVALQVIWQQVICLPMPVQYQSLRKFSASSFEHGNESPSSITGWVFINKLKDSQLASSDSDAWSWFKTFMEVTNEGVEWVTGWTDLMDIVLYYGKVTW
jgi:hypothetical protein